VTQPKIAIIIGSTREGRFGDKPAAWIHSLAAKRDDFPHLAQSAGPMFDELAWWARARRSARVAAAR
jgi:NAD(P)H-dependent FMN reductase